MKTRKIELEINDTPIKDRGTTDYHYTMTKGSSKKQRELYDTGNIWINGAVCLYCHDFIRSMNRHDYKSCSCGKTGVDGGSWHIKRMGDNYIDVIEKFND